MAPQKSGPSVVPVCGAVGLHQISLTHPKAHRLRRHCQGVDLRAIVRCLADCALQPSRSSVSTKVAVASVAPHHGLLRWLSLGTELHCVEVWCAFPDSRRPGQYDFSVMSKRRIDVFGPGRLGVGHIVVAAFCPRLSR